MCGAVMAGADDEDNHTALTRCGPGTEPAEAGYQLAQMERTLNCRRGVSDDGLCL